MKPEFTPVVARRVKQMTRAQRRFFYAPLNERLPLANQFDDTPRDQIVHDCLNYAEAPGLDLTSELAELRKPIPCTTQRDSSAGWAMKRTQE